MNFAKMIEKAGAIGVMIGPQSEPSVVKVFEDLGGGRRTGIAIWRGLDMMQHLVLLADSRKRIKHLAPLALIARDRKTLTEVIGQIMRSARWSAMRLDRHG